MTKNILMVVAAFLAGLLGGVLSGKWISPDEAEVQQELGSKNVVVANEFHLVDDHGKDRWVLKLSMDGEPNITFINQNGWAPMAMGVNKSGLPYFNMVLEPDKETGPSLVLMDSQMRNRALLGLDRDGQPHLSLLDQAGRVRAALGSVELTNPATGLKEKRPCSSLVLMDEKGEVVWSTPEFSTLMVQNPFKGEGSP
ncbi:MAG: hypothetical protein P8175_09660 [Deltaproteobacteria bacterium]